VCVVDGSAGALHVDDDLDGLVFFGGFGLALHFVDGAQELVGDVGEDGGTARDPTAAMAKTAAHYPAPQTYPNENHEIIAQHLSQARKLAGSDLFQDMAHRCIISPRFPLRVEGIQYPGKIIPTKLFDNLYSIGQNQVSSQALVTSAGIIVFDTLNNEDEARNLLVPNMIKLGLNPGDIKYIVISHEHPDHYGGARYLQKTYGARVIASVNDSTASLS